MNSKQELRRFLWVSYSDFILVNRLILPEYSFSLEKFVGNISMSLALGSETLLRIRNNTSTPPFRSQNIILYFLLSAELQSIAIMSTDLTMVLR